MGVTNYENFANGWQVGKIKIWQLMSFYLQQGDASWWTKGTHQPTAAYICQIYADLREFLPRESEISIQVL